MIPSNWFPKVLSNYPGKKPQPVWREDLKGKVERTQWLEGGRRRATIVVKVWSSGKVVFGRRGIR